MAFITPLMWSECSCVMKIQRRFFGDVPSADSAHSSERRETPASMRNSSPPFFTYVQLPFEEEKSVQEMG